MSRPKKKESEKTLVAEPAVNAEQKLAPGVNGQAEPKGEAGPAVKDEDLLARHEQAIKANLGGFMKVGEALKAINDGKLYQVAKFATFDDYCRQQWGLGRKYAYRLIEAYTVVDKLQQELLPLNVTRFPTHESQARPLTPLEPDKQVKAWQQVLEVCKDKPITADEVQAVVDKMVGKPTEKSTTGQTKLKKAERKLAKIGKLVTDALEVGDSEQTVAKFKEFLEKIRKLIGPKK